MQNKTLCNDTQTEAALLYIVVCVKGHRILND